MGYLPHWPTNVRLKHEMTKAGVTHKDRVAASSLIVQTDRQWDATTITSGPIAHIVFIDSLELTRECIVKQLAANLTEYRIAGFGRVDEIASGGTRSVKPCCAIYNSHSTPISDSQVTRDLYLLQNIVSGCRVILLSGIDQTDHIVGAMHHGLVGYIPASLTLEVVSQAIRLVLIGGIFVPAGILASIGSLEPFRSSDWSDSWHYHIRLTPRQAEVLRQLWDGKPNKTIAHELGMSVGTAKVHIKQIMKKAGAHNRTQAVLITQQMVPLQKMLTARGT
jgi:DNA-binding NarL/FixJ family response regulator